MNAKAGECSSSPPSWRPRRIRLSSSFAGPRTSGALTTTETFVKVRPPSLLRKTKTLFFESTLEARTVFPLTGEIVSAYQNGVAITPDDFFHVFPPLVVTESDDLPLLMSQTTMCAPFFGSTVTAPGHVKGHDSCVTVSPPSVDLNIPFGP